MRYRKGLCLVLTLVIVWSYVKTTEASGIFSDKGRSFGNSIYYGSEDDRILIKENIELLSISDIVAEINQSKIEYVANLGEVVRNGYRNFDTLPANTSKPQDVTTGFNVSGNAYKNIADIRQRISARAYQYLRVETEYGRIGYSMYALTANSKNSQGHWIGNYPGSHYIRNSWYEVTGTGRTKFWLDCSSFVGKVYQDCETMRPNGHVYTPVMTTREWAKSGVTITYDELMAGDILNISGSHVGLYVGNGKVIECHGAGSPSKYPNIHATQVQNDSHQIRESNVDEWKRQKYIPIRPSGLPTS